MTTHVTPVDPEQLFRSPAFAQGMIAPAGPLLFVGGQNGTDASGRLLDGLRAQTEQALRNVLAVLSAAGTGPEHVVKMNINIAPGIDPDDAYAASAAVWSERTMWSAIDLRIGLRGSPVSGLGWWVSGLGCRVSGLGCRVSGVGSSL